MSRVLMVCAEPMGDLLAGPAIRAFELSRALAGEHSVTLAAAAPLRADADGVRLVEATARRLRQEAAQHDVVVVQGSAQREFEALATTERPLIVDLYDPYVLESFDMHSNLPPAARQARARDDARALLRQLTAADAFLCASERQRQLWLGALAAAGRVNPLTQADDPEVRQLLRIVPFGLPAEPPAAIEAEVAGLRPDAQLVLWAGGIWNWLDPLTLIRAASTLRPELPRLQVLFMGTGHPNPGVPAMRRAAEARQLAEELGLLGQVVVFHEGWTPYERRAGLLNRAAVAVSLHEASLEAEFAFRTRVLDHLWAGVPSLLTSGESMADLCAAEGFGLTVAPGDLDAAVDCLRRLLTDAALQASCRTAARRSASRFQWKLVAEPLADLCREPRRAPDLPRSRTQALSGLPRRRRASRAWEIARQEGAGSLARRAGGRLRRRLR